MMSLASATIVLAIASTLPASAEAGPVRVVASTATRLELAVQLLDESGNPASPTIREFVLERESEVQPWRLVQGLSEGEIAGPSRLATVTPDGTTNPFRRVSPEIAASAGEGVTLIDLPEGDAALCIWSGGKVREAWFVDGYFPEFRQAAGLPAAVHPVRFLCLSNVSAHSLPHIRACITRCFSTSVADALAARNQLASGSPRPGAASGGSPDPALRHALEASDAAFAFGQVGVDPPEDATTDLFRWIMAEAQAAFAVASTGDQRRPAPDDQAASDGAARRDASDSIAETRSGDQGSP